MKRLTISVFCLLCCILLGCTKESIKNAWANQENYIESFLEAQKSSNADAYVVSNGGSERLVVKEGEGDGVGPKGTVSFYYALYTMTSSSINQSSLVATNHKETADALQWVVSDEEAFNVKTINLSEVDLIEGLRKGLEGVKGGEECYILFSGRYGFKNSKMGTIPANTALAYHIWVHSVSND